MRLGKIVASDSHLQYRCQVYGPREVSDAPQPDDYGLGNFVAVPVGDRRALVGIISDTQLHNPEFGSFSPRLSSDEELEIFSPDYLAETRTLVSVAVIGYFDENGRPHQDAPPVAPPVNTDVQLMTDEQLRSFHQPGDEVCLSYLPFLIAAARTSPVMMQAILKALQHLQAVFADGPASLRLRLVRQNLSWQFRVAGMA